MPLAGLTPSQAESLEAVKLSVPVPVLVTLMDAGEGFVPLPCVALKVSEVPERERMGCGGGGGEEPAGVRLSPQTQAYSINPVPEFIVSANSVPSAFPTSYHAEEHAGTEVAPATILRASNSAPGLT